jgi:hypothetical protein
MVIIYRTLTKANTVALHLYFHELKPSMHHSVPPVMEPEERAKSSAYSLKPCTCVVYID